MNTWWTTLRAWKSHLPDSDLAPPCSFCSFLAISCCLIASTRLIVHPVNSPYCDRPEEETRWHWSLFTVTVTVNQYIWTSLFFVPVRYGRAITWLQVPFFTHMNLNPRHYVLRLFCHLKEVLKKTESVWWFSTAENSPSSLCAIQTCYVATLVTTNPYTKHFLLYRN